MAFSYRRRVQFAETDAAGMAHFAVFFRYMEEAEHAVWRAAGMSIHTSPPAVAPEGRFGAAPPKLAGDTSSEGGESKWPRVAATFDFKKPLRFEDEFEVRVSMASASARTIQWGHEIVRGSELIGAGSVTAACVRADVNGAMTAVEVPADVLEKLRRVLQAS